MENNHDIKIVRFKGGIDVVCHCNDEETDTLEIDTPMIFEIRNTNLVMHHWLPLSLMKDKKVKIKTQDVLCVYEPNEEFAEYYHEMVTNMNTFVNKKQTDEDTQAMLQALSELEGMDASDIH